MSNNLKPAIAVSAWRNKGEGLAPITVRFVQTKVRQSSNLNSRLVSRGLGINSNTTQSKLYNCTEEAFDELFAHLGVKAEEVTNGYRDAKGNITAKELNFSTTEVFGEPVFISRYETTDDMQALNDDGSIKLDWSIKEVEGQQLTHEGALIYSTHIFTEDGVDQKLQHDQDLSRSNKAVTNVESIKESKPATESTKEPEAEMSFEESNDSEEGQFDF